MKPSDALNAHRAEIREIVQRHRAQNARVFGSVARGTDREDSDLDLLIDRNGRITLMDLGAIIHEIKKLLGVKVDVLMEESLPVDVRDVVLSEAVPV